MGEEGGEDKGQARGAEDGAGSVRVDDEARESAVLVGVPAMHLPAVQLDEDFIAHIQVQDDAVAGVVVVLVCVLGNGAGPHLRGWESRGVCQRGAGREVGPRMEGTVRGKVATSEDLEALKAPLPAPSGL